MVRLIIIHISFIPFLEGIKNNFHRINYHVYYQTLISLYPFSTIDSQSFRIKKNQDVPENSAKEERNKGEERVLLTIVKSSGNVFRPAKNNVYFFYW